MESISLINKTWLGAFVHRFTNLPANINPIGVNEASSAGIEYDEAKERKIAEYIYDWWFSKQSVQQYFVDTFSPRLDLKFEDDEQD